MAILVMFARVVTKICTLCGRRSRCQPRCGAQVPHLATWYSHLWIAFCWIQIAFIWIQIAFICIFLHFGFQWNSFAWEIAFLLQLRSECEMRFKCDLNAIPMRFEYDFNATCDSNAIKCDFDAIVSGHCVILVCTPRHVARTPLLPTIAKWSLFYRFCIFRENRI